MKVAVCVAPVASVVVSASGVTVTALVACALMVTRKLQVAVRAAASVTVYFTVVVPSLYAMLFTGFSDPETGLETVPVGLAGSTTPAPVMLQLNPVTAQLSE